MPDFDETLLSAYIDGELPPDERARVEQWLAEQPEGRQLLEELRSTKTGLERLPRDRLPHDFSEQVLRQAEREMLTSSGEAQQPPRGFFWQRFRRPLLWASLAMAAGLLLMVFDRDRQPPAALRQVALAPGEPQDGPAIGAPAGETAKSGEGFSGELPDSSAVSGPASGPAAMAAGAAPADESGERNDVPRGRLSASGKQIGADGKNAAGMRRTELGVTADALPRKDDVSLRLGQDAEVNDYAALSDQALLVWCEVSPDAQYNERFRELLLSNSITWSDAGEKQAAGLLSASRGFHDENAVKETAPPAAPATTDEPRAKAIAEKPRSRSQVPAREANGQRTAGRSGAFYGRPAASQNQRRLLEAGQAALDADAELVLVEASEPQIKAVLAELDRDDDVFKAVDVEPAEDAPRQQQFGRYRRGIISARQLAQRKAGMAQKTKPADKAEANRDPVEPVANEAQGASQQGIAYRLRGGVGLPALQREALHDLKRAAAVGDENRLQVLFVLQPTDDSKPAAAPADEKQPDEKQPGTD